MSAPAVTTLIAGPRLWQRAQRWPGALLLVAGLWSLVYGVEPVALAFVAVGFWLTAEFWRGLRVTGDVLVAQGRLTRRRLPLSEVRQVGHTRAGTAWVRPREGRTLVLAMAEKRIDQPGSAGSVRIALREQAAAAGADLEPEPAGPGRPPRPATVVFGW
jgi:hypothetical protein